MPVWYHLAQSYKGCLSQICQISFQYHSRAHFLEIKHFSGSAHLERLGITFTPTLLHIPTASRILDTAEPIFRGLIIIYLVVDLIHSSLTSGLVTDVRALARTIFFREQLETPWEG